MKDIFQDLLILAIMFCFGFFGAKYLSDPKTITVPSRELVGTNYVAFLSTNGNIYYWAKEPMSMFSPNIHELK